MNKEEKSNEENYKAVILVFAGVQVIIALLQLVQSIIDSQWTFGKLLSLVGLTITGIGLWIFVWKLNKK